MEVPEEGNRPNSRGWGENTQLLWEARKRLDRFMKLRYNESKKVVLDVALMEF